MKTTRDSESAPQPAPSGNALSEAARSGGRILAAVGLVLFGAFLAINGCVVIWLVRAEGLKPSPAGNAYHWVTIGSITLSGWQVYAFAGLLLLVAAGSVVVGFSLFRKRTG